MARNPTSPAEKKRRREMMAAALESARSSRLAAEAAREAAATTAQTASAGAKRREARALAEVQTTGMVTVAPRCDSSRQRAARASDCVPESMMTTWMREHGESNKMSVVSNAEIASNGGRVWVIRCDACDKVMRSKGTANLHAHANCAAHVAALESGSAPVCKVATWIRLHGEANEMTVVSGHGVNSSGTPVWSVRCAACATVLQATSVNSLQRHAICVAHVAAIESGKGRESNVATWIREYGDVNKMTVVSHEVRAHGKRVWVIRCGACDAVIRACGAGALHKHANCAPHAAALTSGKTREPKLAAWMREHGEANKMTLVSSDERTAGGGRVWVIRCDGCGREIRATGPKVLEAHAACATHAAALDPAHAPEPAVAKWIREHGEANQITVVSHEVRAHGKRVWVIRCGACDKVLRVPDVHTLQRHVALHAAAPEGDDGRPTLRGAQRKRPRP
jgi:rRNA maturation endonuclease Nob1